MKTVIFAVLAVVFSASAAFASSYIDGTLISVDAKKKTITLADRSIMELPSVFDATAVPLGQKVRIFAEIDEDGFSPITKIDIIK